MRRLTALCVAVLLVTTGLAGLVPAAGAVEDPSDSQQFVEPSEGREQFAAAPPDPKNDTLGWENGYWHNESIDVDQSDGLTDAELEAYVSRAMARVEYIREREFDETVPVSVISRENYTRQTANQTETNGSFADWNNQVWEALFIIGERNNAQSEISSTYGGSVAGFYSPSDDEIKIVTESTDEVVMDNATLVHELTHALEDQHYNLSSPRYAAPTQDGQLGVDGILEGETSYVEERYVQRCGDAWSCVETPAQSGGGGGSAPNLGLFVTIFQPYSDGPVYVHDLYERGGWDAVDQRLQNPPASTEQVIHSTDEEPVSIEFEDRAVNNWTTYPDQGMNGSDTVGEASIYAMFWYQNREYGADTVDWRSFLEPTSAYDTYNYDATPSAGWAGDRVFPYRQETGNETEHGYVWITEWDTARDAREFEQAYLNILDAHDAAVTEDDVYVVDSGPFADAFRVVRDGTRVTIVNGPDPAAVEDIRPGLEAPQTPTPTASPTPTPADTGDGETETTTAASPTPTASTETTTDGFGVVAALAALATLAVAVLVRRR